MEYLAFFVQLIEYFLYNIFCCLLPNGKFLSEEAQSNEEFFVQYEKSFFFYLWIKR